MGDPCIYDDEWATFVVATDRPGFARIRFVGGTPPSECEAELTVRVGRLRRAHAAKPHLPGARICRSDTWTAAELRQVRWCWLRGDRAEAVSLTGRTEAACAKAMWLWWGLPQRGASLSTFDVARILGCHPNAVMRLCDAGILRCERPQTERRIAPADLARFLTDHPLRYDPAQVTDPPWRGIVREALGGDPFLTSVEAAREIGYTADGMRRRFRRGRQAGGCALIRRGQRTEWSWVTRRSWLTLAPDQIKRCPRCAWTLPKTEFYGDSTRRGDGLAAWCKRCTNARNVRSYHDRQEQAS